MYKRVESIQFSMHLYTFFYIYNKLNKLMSKMFVILWWNQIFMKSILFISILSIFKQKCPRECNIHPIHHSDFISTTQNLIFVFLCLFFLCFHIIFSAVFFSLSLYFSVCIIWYICWSYGECGHDGWFVQEKQTFSFLGTIYT